MKCPYCEREMKSGFISSRGEILRWTPRGENKPLTWWGISKNGIRLGDSPGFFGGKVDADYCVNCKKVIISVSG